MSFSLNQKEGWLSKKGGNIKNWKRRYFVVEQNSHNNFGAIIRYYENETKEVKKGKIELKSVLDIQSRSPPYKTPIFEIQTISRNYLLQADSMSEMLEWLAFLSNFKEMDGNKAMVSRYGFVKEGNLNKLGKVRKNWKTRHFTLYSSPPQLTYGKASNSSTAKGFIDIPEIIDIKEGENKEEGFFEIITENRIFSLKADSSDEMRDWIESIISIVQVNRNDSNFKSDLTQSIEYVKRRMSVRNTMIKQGWLSKRGESALSSYLKRYFILQCFDGPNFRAVLKYFDGPDSGIPNGTIELSKTKKITRDGVDLEIEVPGRFYYLKAKTEDDAISWFSQLLSCCPHLPPLL